MVDKSEKLEWLARLGYAVRGLVYILFGYLALSTSGQSVRDGPSDVLTYLRDVPAGTAILYVAALGLLGYALFRLFTSLFDAENHGSKPKGLAVRAGHFGSAIAHLALSYTAFQLAQGSGGSSGGGQQASRTLLSVEFGPLILGLLGVALLAAAAMQAKTAFDAGFMKRIRPDAPDLTAPIGRAGHAARAAVFAIVGWSLVRTGWLSSGEEVKSLGTALLSLKENTVIYALVAAGLLLFGVFSLIAARYRIIPDIDPGSAARRALA